MTALDKYIRLEAVGQWRESPEADPREVVVSFGDATLVLSDMQENPLTHWALAGIVRVKHEQEMAIYTPDTQGFETLEIRDSDMIEAIAQVSRIALNQTRPVRRGFGLWIALGLLLIGVLAVAPIFVRYQAQAMTGPDSARYLGYQLIDMTGVQTCSSPEGNTARDSLMANLYPDGRYQLLVTADQSESHLYPGGLVVMSNSTLQDLTTQKDFANYIENIDINPNLVLTDSFQAAPLSKVFRYVSSGEMDPEMLSQILDSIEVNNILSPGDQEYVEDDNPVLRDMDWRALRQICLD